MYEFSPLEHFQAAMHSVALIRTVAEKTPKSAEDIAVIKANGQHLQIMLAKPIFSADQISALQVGVVQAQQFVYLGIAPKPTVPQSVTMRQARLALHFAGYLTAVTDAIAAMAEPDKTAAQITWDYAATVDRGFGMVPQLAEALGMTDAQIDDLFIAAAKL